MKEEKREKRPIRKVIELEPKLGFILKYCHITPQERLKQRRFLMLKQKKRKKRDSKVITLGCSSQFFFFSRVAVLKYLT